MKLFLFILSLLCNLPSMAQEPIVLEKYLIEGLRKYTIDLPSDISYCEEESLPESFYEVYYNQDKSFSFCCQFLKTDEDFRPHEWLAGEYLKYGIDISSYDQFTNLVLGEGYMNVHSCYYFGRKVLSIGIISNIHHEGWAALLYVLGTESQDDYVCRVIPSFRFYQQQNQ